MNRIHAKVATTLLFGGWAFGLVATFSFGIYPIEYVIALHTAAMVMILAVAYVEVLFDE